MSKTGHSQTGADAPKERVGSLDLASIEAASAVTAAYDLTEVTQTEYPSDLLHLKGATDLAIPDLTLIIPMFRESARIEQTIVTLANSSLNRSGVAFLFVDDGSGDRTAEVAEAAIRTEGLRFAEVKSLPENVGKGGAVKAGMSAARGRYLGYLDADLSLDPADVSRALARIETTGVDLVVGERVVDTSRQPRLRRFASGVFRRLAEGISGVRIADPQCAMKIFRTDVATELFGALTVNGFAFDVEVLARAARKNYQVEEMKIRWQHQPGSKVNPVTDGLRMYAELLRIRRRMNSER
jgi:dolichyl-phosphate beta-glucosyltransferase